MSAKPTNEHIAELLGRVLQEISEVKEAQQQLAADLREVTRRTSS